MKKIYILLLACVCCAAAQAYNYSVTQENAHWDFEDLTSVRPTASAAAFFVPNTWKTGTSIAAYMPYVYPNGNQETSSVDRGYQSRHCLYLQNPSSATRVPVYAMMPQVSDKAYSNLKLEFMARTFNSTLDTQTSNTVYGDWKLGYLTDLADTAKANFTANVHYACDVNLTADWTKYSFDLDTIPNGAYMVLYVTDAAHIRYMFVDDVAFVEQSSAPSNPTITYNLTHYTGVSTNPTEITDAETDELNMAFVVESGYELGSLSVTLGGVALDDLMQNYYADPYYYTLVGHDTLYVVIGAILDYLNADVVVTLAGQELPAPAVTPIAGPATFEEYQTVLPATGGKYNPYEQDGTHYWQSGDYTFSCTRSYGGMMNDGFYAANFTDTSWVSYDDDYKAMARSGVNGSETYASMYYGGSWGGPCTITFSERTLTGTYVCLALNPYRCIHGRSWSTAFANGDYLYLHLSGKKNGVYTGTSADFYLADYRNGKTEDVTEWTWMDLSGLGLVDEVEAVIYDSQSGAGVGLYACFDDFGGVGPQVPTGLSQVQAEKTVKFLENGQLRVLRGGHVYDASGRLLK